MTLVVVDGTWSQAKSVVRDNPVLQALPRYAFATPEPSQYRIRREPRAEYVSTIEALMHVLGVLEGEPARFRRLLDPLNAMVDAQLACQAAAPARRLRKPTPPRPSKVPFAVRQRLDDLVCVVGEANAWPYGAPEAKPEELVQWTACRVATGETFDLICAPEHPLSPSTAFHTGLAEADLRGGMRRAELFERFEAFLQPRYELCTWGYYSLNLYAASGGSPVLAMPSWRLDLRAAAQRLTNQKLGDLEAYASTLGPPPAPLARGRAGRRLARLVQIVRDWHSRS